MRLRLLLSAAAAALGAAPTHAVIRPSMEGHADTLQLNSWEARQFRFYKLAGEDIHDFSLVLALAAIPAVVAASAAADKLGPAESLFRNPADAAFFLTYVALPALASAMATGNLVYARATEFHEGREYALQRSLLPIMAFSLTAAKLFVYIPNRHVNAFDGVSRGFVIAGMFTEAITLAALTKQFSTARAFLDNVVIRVNPEGQAVGLKVDF